MLNKNIGSNLVNECSKSFGGTMNLNESPSIRQSICQPNPSSFAPSLSRAVSNKFGHAKRQMRPPAVVTPSSPRHPLPQPPSSPPTPPLAIPSLFQSPKSITRVFADSKKTRYRRTDGPTDGPTDRRTDGRTDGRTDPLIEMRGRI